MVHQLKCSLNLFLKRNNELSIFSLFGNLLNGKALMDAFPKCFKFCLGKFQVLTASPLVVFP